MRREHGQVIEREALVQETMRLIAMPSDEDCSEVLEYLQSRLRFLPWERQEVGKEVNGKSQYNLLALSPEKPLILNTHVDTVPPLGMDAPFTPRREGDRIYGRGAVDTKGLIAALVIALEACYREYGEVPVSVAFTVDEESTSALGSVKLAERLGQEHAVIVLEATQGQICTRQAGSLEFELRSASPPRHAALFQGGLHPIRVLMAFVQAAERALQRPLNILAFQGGWDHYATPPEARMLAEVLIPPGQRWAPLEEALRLLAETAFSGQVEYRRVDAEDPFDFGHHWATALLAEAYTKALGMPPVYGTVPSWTDAANFAKAGARCVVFGFGDLGRAHGWEEYITVEELARTAEVLYTLFTILIHSPHRSLLRRKPSRR